jgi:uncharacterized protein YukE
MNITNVSNSGRGPSEGFAVTHASTFTARRRRERGHTRRFRPFVESCEPRVVLSTIASELVNGVAGLLTETAKNEVESVVGSTVWGWAMTLVGAQSDDYDAQFDRINKKLGEISNQIENIESQLTAINAAVNEIALNQEVGNLHLSQIDSVQELYQATLKTGTSPSEKV